MMSDSALFRAIVGPVVQQQQEDETPVIYRRDSRLFRFPPDLKLPVNDLPLLPEFDDTES